MTKPKTLDQLRAEKERAETQLAQEKHKLERLEHPYVEKKIKGGVAALEKNLSLYKQELERNSSVDMAAKKEADLSAAKDAFGGFTDQSDDPTKGAGQSIDDVVAKLMAEQEKIIQKKEENDE